MDSENKRYTVVISDEAMQMLISHARFLAQVSEHEIKENTVYVDAVVDTRQDYGWLS